MLGRHRTAAGVLLAAALSACAATASVPGTTATAPPAPSAPAASATPAPSAASTPAPTTPTPVSHAGVAMPNPAFTPGEVFAGATVQQVCTPGYASSVRHVTSSQYHEVYAEYGIPYPQPSGTYELDHLVPLEVGGDNSDRNLWPEPASPTPGFHQKDQLEDALHGMVCSGHIALAEAQHEIATDWYAAYRRYVTG